jgi:hypothetical protein
MVISEMIRIRHRSFVTVKLVHVRYEASGQQETLQKDLIISRRKSYKPFQRGYGI